MKYTIVVPKPVQKQLDKLPQEVRARMVRRIALLEDDPRPRGCVKLHGEYDEYRIRIGDYRLRYDIRDQEAVVVLLHSEHRCKHRKDVYRG